jgi:hypothetical protein
MKTFKSFIGIILIVSIAVSCLVAQQKRKTVRVLKNLNLGEVQKLNNLNTKYWESNISITPDGKYLYFETDRPSEWSTPNYSAGRYDIDIWFSKLVDGVWQEPKNVGKNINTPQSEGEPNISPDGQTMYFQSWRTDWKTTGGPYYKAELKGEQWTNPIGLNSGITKFFIEMDKKRIPNKSLGTDGATFSPDGKTFIFSFGLDYYGNLDIYITKQNEKGEWSDPKILPISTEFNDRCPFLAADGKTLYFASNGYTGFGKLDIFKTTINEDGTCGEVVNIGEPFNTKDEDFGFLITASGNDIYFVRNSDIYQMNIKNAETEIRPAHTVILSGIVRDSETKRPLESIVIITDPKTKKEIGSSRSNSKTGEYSIVLMGNKKYSQNVNKEAYDPYLQDIETSSDLTENNLNLDVELKPIKKKEPVIEKVIEKPIEKIQKVEKEEIAPPCISRFLDQSYSIGINPAYPLAVGILGEYHLNNYGASLIGMYLPNVGKYDDPKVPDDLNGNNYTTLFLASVNYNFPLFKCWLYPNIGLFTGVRTRYWKKDILAGFKPNNPIIKEGSYSDNPWGVTLGAKLFLSERFYVDITVALGRYAFHDFPSGDISKYEFKYIPWFALCYKF